MNLALIVCTYMRPHSLSNLLETVLIQTKIPNEIIIVDGSTNEKTKAMLDDKLYDLNIHYYKVSDEERGLTKQRNYGVERVSKDMEIIGFLDDDIELSKEYFEQLCDVYNEHQDAICVGGITTNEVSWETAQDNEPKSSAYYQIDGFKRRDDLRYRLRKLFGLVSKDRPGRIAPFGHERSVGFLPPTGLTYEVDFLMGGIATYKRDIFEHLSFSKFFEGYGLYEDKDFTLKVRKYGKLYVNTAARVEHHHDPLGRPNYIKYGKMVVLNGWRVWRVATPNPSVGSILKWWSISLLLSYVRFANAIIGPNRKVALDDFIGRQLGFLRLLYRKPNMDD